MVFDQAGDPVNAYANVLYNRLQHYINKTAVEGKTTRILYFSPDLYPDPVNESYISISHVERGDIKTSAEYVENWSGKRWACRWGRHDNDHNSRDHFHHPPAPDADTDPYAYDADYPQNALMMKVPVEFIRERVNQLAGTDAYDYPSEYIWDNEYQPSRYEPPES